MFDPKCHGCVFFCSVMFCVLGAPLLIYIGGGGRSSQGGAPSGAESHLGSCPGSPPLPCIGARGRKWRWRPPFLSPLRRGRKEGLALPWPAWWRGAPVPCGLVCPSLGPLSPYLCRGCPEPLLVTLYVPGTLQNTSCARISRICLQRIYNF